MYDPYIGRWLQEDPIGFDAGDINLYRYVGNSPTNATDPSGLQPPAYGTRPFWQTEPRSFLDISGSRDRDLVMRAIASVDTQFRLSTIPVLTPNGEARPFLGITADRANISGRAMNGGGVISQPIATPAQLARINIRVNLLHLKQGLVDGIFNMVMNNPARDVDFDPDPVAAMANRTADELIRMVDLFLRTHSGARPEQGQRNWVANAFGLQNRLNAPWCADWAGAMSAWTDQVIVFRGEEHPANHYLEFRWGQANNNGQHNFLTIMPQGHQIQFSRPGNDAVDPVILLFDPWRELMPRLYRPIPLTQANGAPTHIQEGVDSEEYLFYRDNRRLPQFNHQQLRLGIHAP